MKVKPEQAHLVSSILESASFGPTTVDSMIIWNKSIEEAGRLHVEFVIEQLLHAGCLSRTSDHRFITTREGEVFGLKTQHVA
ncbi:hypothetical protein [Vibrio vulnificus]|uniref:hypothetical protein n=1 Tax=Vibrio vulnificus TaxID=672 RepID=UPI0019D4E52B|nr:hypothetical protein [Vibrio vulnificus]MBN8085904.1 hypothetical protein [Vibrio vulnificus]MBN8128932.1 hypothetical protein [Vibrio vulnificus]HAS6055336.1 hypothetical protein [Vibrio vulnificus]HAS6258250.1 hypothetical protein [Vibrio vulnificus]HDY8076661.1 hypothetical protein [Vibrio vulnificus]